MRSDRKVKGVIVALKFIAPWKSNYPRNLSLSVDKGCKDLFSKKNLVGLRPLDWALQRLFWVGDIDA